jgi:hypothetical protein
MTPTEIAELRGRLGHALQKLEQREQYFAQFEARKYLPRTRAEVGRGLLVREAA